jgi:hypothetical protein
MSNSPVTNIRRTETSLGQADPFTTAIRAAVAAEIDRLRDELVEVVAARPAKRLLDGQELGQLLQVTAPTIRKLREEGLPYVSLGAVRRYDPDVVLAWLTARQQIKNEAGQ